MNSPEPSRRSLLLAAFPPELGEWLEHPPAGWRTACVGVGAITAAASTARLIALDQPDRVIFIGTCGAYGSSPALGTCVAAGEILAISLEEVRQEAYRPKIERTRWHADLELPFPTARVAVPPAITCSEGGANLLEAFAEVEHLELSGVFEAAQTAGVPVGAVLGVANCVGPQAHGEWRRHHEQVSQNLISLLLASGALA